MKSGARKIVRAIPRGTGVPLPARGTPAALPEIRRVLSRVNRDLKSADRTARCCAAAMRLVCRGLQLSPGEILSRRRAEKWVVARWALVWLARKAGRLSLREIGRYLNQSHGAVVLGLRRLPDLIETQPALAKKLALMERELEKSLKADE